MAHQAQDKDNRALVVEEFIENLYFILLQFNESRQDVMEKFFAEDCNYNFVYMLLISVAKEIFMFGIHSFKFLKTKMQPIFF